MILNQDSMRGNWAPHNPGEERKAPLRSNQHSPNYLFQIGQETRFDTLCLRMRDEAMKSS